MHTRQNLTFVLILSLLCALLAPAALADGAPVGPVDAALATFSGLYGELEGCETRVTHAYLLEVSDRSALSEHCALAFADCDAAVYITAEQYVAGLPLPSLISACYTVSADGTATLRPKLLTFNWPDWQSVLAGITITEAELPAEAE